MKAMKNIWCFWLFLTLFLLPIDSFPMGISLLREFGARIVNFMLLILSLYALFELFFFNRFMIHKDSDCAIVLFVFLIALSLGNLIYRSFVLTQKADASAFALQALMLIWAFTSFFVWSFFLRKLKLGDVHLNNSSISMNNRVIILSSLLVVLLFWGDVVFSFCVAPGNDLLSFLRLKGECFRASGLASEPSLFGAWCNFIIPFILVTVRGQKSKLFIICLIVCAAIYSGARTFFVIAIFQAFIFIYPSIFMAVVLSIISIAMYPLAYNLFSDLDLSVLARLSSSYAALLGFLDSPLLGYGIGQFSIHFPSYVPSDALVSDEVYAWYTGSATYRISTFSLPVRLLFEFGIIGGLMFFLLIVLPFLWVKNKQFSSYEKRCLFALIVGAQGFVYSQDQYAYQILIFVYAFIYVFASERKIYMER